MTTAMHKRMMVMLLLASLLAVGCVNVQTLPSYARAGDVVSVGMAGIKLNTDGKITLTAQDITATITDASSTVHPVKVLKTFRAFPDHTSANLFGTLDRDTVNNSVYATLQPFDGQWWVSVHLVDPGNDIPLPLAVGAATLQLSAPGVTDTWASDGDLNAIHVEIIGGIVNKASTDPDFYMYNAFAPTQALTIQPDSLTGIAKIGGLQLKLDYDPGALVSGTARVPHLVPISHDPHINIIQKNVDNGDGTYALVAMITNPLGFVPDATYVSGWTIGASTFNDLNLAVLTEDADFSSYTTNYTIDMVNSFYIDANGNKLMTVNPVLGLNF